MQYIVCAQEMKRIDTYTSEYFKLPPLVLMERAALATVAEIKKRYHKTGKVLIAAGCGNNGGDGLAIGRILWEQGYDVTFWMLAGNLSEQTKLQKEILEQYGLEIHDIFPPGEYDIVIDALFGIGLSRDVEGSCLEMIETINHLGKKAYICAVDIPSGLSSDSGKPMKTAVKANLTVTFAYKKLGQVLYPGAEYCGENVVCSIGITNRSFTEQEPVFFTYEETVRELLPVRDPAGNKGTFGKVLVVAGSKGMSGACLFCAKSVLRTGAGMVKILTQENHCSILQKQLPEAMVLSYNQEPQIETLAEAEAFADVIVIGPGIGTKQSGRQMLDYMINQSDKPLIIDADGLNLLASEPDLAASLSGQKKRVVILTPHPGELSRLAKCSVEAIKENQMQTARTLADKLSCIVVAKDARTMVCEANRDTIFINTKGNSGMATAGAGDVLAGIIAGLVAQKMEGFTSATVGVYLHACAGDAAALRLGEYAVLASDIIDEISGQMTRKEAEKC